MFYSRQLLARKAPLGQIWMAATMKGKMNRKELVKLNIIKICEEIMNPSVPMALRLSGILMGGVVIVYERKVKLLYDDVNRLLVELNQAWKVTAMPDPTVLPKGKSQAKYRSITLPENRDHDLGEPEQSLHYTDEATTMMGFTQTDYIAMRLDNMDDPYVDQNPEENCHQANAADITMVDIPDLTMEDTSMYKCFERFDIEGDEETHLDFATQEHFTNPTIIPSPPPQEKPRQGDEILKQQHPEHQVNIRAATDMEVHQQDQFRQGVNRRRARRPVALAMDNEQTIIPGHIYHSWLQDTSDITSRSRNRNKRQLDAMTKRKIAHIVELPPTLLVEGLYTYGLEEVHFPSPLLELWRKTNHAQHDSESGTNTTCQHPEPSLTFPPEGMHDQETFQYPFEDLRAGVGSVREGVSIEKQRASVNINNLQPEVLMEELRATTSNIKIQLPEANGMSFNKTNLMATPGNSDDEVRSIPSSGSGHAFLSHNSNNSTRSNKKRPISPFRNMNNGLEPVDEESSWQHPDPNLKLARLYANEVMVETGPTQTQKHPLMSQPADPITHSIRMQLKAHFETPGTPKVESLNHLARGLDRKKAASLFYQTCVLATEDSIRVHQKGPYGDILITRGSKI